MGIKRSSKLNRTHQQKTRPTQLASKKSLMLVASQGHILRKKFGSVTASPTFISSQPMSFRPANVIPPNQRHPRAAIVIPAHAGIQKSRPTGGAAYRASFRRNPAERPSTRAQANILPAQPSSPQPTQRHPRAAIVIPAHAGTQNGEQTERASKRPSFRCTRAPKRTERPSNKAGQEGCLPSTQSSSKCAPPSVRDGRTRPNRLLRLKQ